MRILGMNQPIEPAKQDPPKKKSVKGLTHIATALQPGEIWTLHGRKIGGVHFRNECGGDNCVLHNPSDHHMRDWYLHFRADRSIFERICEHGTGHPDPDQLDYWQKTGQEWQERHGCDGCCWEPKAEI